jgi:hypothetical protein
MFRDFIMNADHDSDRDQGHRSVLEYQEINKETQVYALSVPQTKVMENNNTWIEV